MHAASNYGHLERSREKNLRSEVIDLHQKSKFCRLLKSLTSDPKFSLRSVQRATMGGRFLNFSLLSQFLEPNAASTKCSVTKCRIVPPILNKNPDFFLKLLPPKFIKLEQKMFVSFNTQIKSNHECWGKL